MTSAARILIAVDLIAPAKPNDQATYKATDRKWTKNGEEIAGFLSQANPNWPKATLASMMEAHLATTTKEVVARLNKKWDEDVAAFDEVYTPDHCGLGRLDRSMASICSKTAATTPSHRGASNGKAAPLSMPARW